MKKPFRILIVDDEQPILDSLGDLVEQWGYTVVTALNASDALDLMKEPDKKIDLAIIDYLMPKTNGLELLKQAGEFDKEIILIIVTGKGSISIAVEAMRAGAADFLEKPVNPEALYHVIRRELRAKQVIDQNAYFMAELAKESSIENIVGQSQKMLSLFNTIQEVAKSDSSVLICGESGTGKELIANHIHYSSERRNGRLEKLSGVDLSSNLVESELFGHEKGAFTSADSVKVGRMELANSGTLFLDEVGDLPITLQPKLLRVLQSKEFYRVGGIKSILSDFRLISATNKNLEEMVKNNEFRSDLYYRLNVVEIDVPPLRDHKEDITPLISHFIRVYRQATSNPIQGVSPDVHEIMIDYNWPGNVRQLRNSIEHAFVFCKDRLIQKQHLPNYVFNKTMITTQNTQECTKLKDMEKALILQSLDRTNWNKSKAAKNLGITRTTLRSKMDRYNISE